MVRILLTILACLILLVSIGLTWGEGRSRADLSYVNPTGINTLDPAQISWTQDIRVAGNVWEGLTSYDPRTSRAVEGAAAFSPDVSADGLVYTFHIHAEARWSNGDPLTAADFVRGWRRAIEPGSAGDYAGFLTDSIDGAAAYYQWRSAVVAELSALALLSRGWPIADEDAALLRERGYPVDDADVDWPSIHSEALHAHAAERSTRFAGVGMVAVDDKTLRVRLIRPIPYFLDLCAFTVMMPCHESIELLREKIGDTGLNAQGLVVYDPQWTKPDYHRNGYPGLITNGPFRIVEWTFKRRLRMEANPYYWDAVNVGCRTIDMLVYGDVNTSLMAYERGDVDLLTDLSVDYDHELARLAASGERPDFYNPSVLGTYFYIFNCTSDEVRGRPNPFVDPRVRKAFALAVDKRAITEDVLSRGDPISDHLVPPSLMPGYESPSAAGHDPNVARALLADAGFAGGAGFPVVDLLFNTTGHHGRICEAMADMWRRELGVRCELRGKEPKTFAEDKINQRYMIARAGWYGDYVDPTTFLDCFATGNGNNDAGYSNPRYDALLEQAAIALDPAERLDILSQAESLLVSDDFPLLAIHQYTNLMAIKPQVHGLHPNPRLIFPFKYVTIGP